MGHDYNKMKENLRKHLESLTPRREGRIVHKTFSA